MFKYVLFIKVITAVRAAACGYTLDTFSRRG